MKKFKYAVCFFWVFLLANLTNLLQAQPISPVHQGNLPQFMAEMNAYYNGMIAIPPSDITNFLDPLAPVSSSYASPDSLKVSNMTSSSITLSWNRAPYPHAYWLGYINLETGAFAHVYLSGTSEEHVFDPLPDGKYLFALKAEDEDGELSPTIIIVADKVVQMGIDRMISCECRTGFSKLIDEKNYANIDEYQGFVINFLGNGNSLEYSAYFALMPYLTEGMKTYKVNPFCGPKPLDLVYGILYPQGDPNELSSIMFDTQNDELLIEFTENIPYDVEVFFCTSINERKADAPKHDTGNQLITIQPNPFSDHIGITVPDPGLPTKAVLTDFMGRVVYQSNSLGTVLETGHLPTGVYYLKVKNSGLELGQKLIKF